MNKILKWMSSWFFSISIIIISLGAGVMAFSSKLGSQKNFTLRPNYAYQGMDMHGPDINNEVLAEILGISFSDLQDAEQKAQEATVKQALDAGLITQKLVDTMKIDDSIKDFVGLRLLVANASVTIDELIARELGIKVDELHSARSVTRDISLNAAVANVTITQDQVDLMKARESLYNFSNPDEILATAMGISKEELTTYRDQNKTTSDIIAELGKSASEVYINYAIAYQFAVQKAVYEEAITQNQADKILLDNLDSFGMVPINGNLLICSDPNCAPRPDPAPPTRFGD